MSGEWSPGGEWGAPSGGGGGSAIGSFAPLAAPSTPHASDDEFDGDALGAAWTVWQPGTPPGFGVTVADSQIAIVTDTYASSTTNLAGIHRAAPSGDWAAWTKVSVSAEGVTPSAHDHGGGLLLASDDIVANPSTADVISWIVSPRAAGTATLAYVINWSAYDTFSSTALALTLPAGTTSLWQRARYASGTTTLSLDMSTDGIGWTRVFSTSSPFITPQRIGFVTRASDGPSLDSPIVRADFLRFSASAAYSQPAPGRVV
jgi:hypothetical protein